MSPATEVTTPDSRETKASEGDLTTHLSPADGAPDLNTTFSRIRADLIGRLDPISTPFGTKPLVCESTPRPSVVLNARPSNYV